MKSAQGTYQYKVFDLTIQSDRELPELISGSASDAPLIYVNHRKVDRPEEDEIRKKDNIELTIKSDFYFLELDNIVRYQAYKKGDATYIDVDVFDEEKDYDAAKAWLYGSMLTVALQMNDIFPFHASAVSHDGGLFLFCGKSGIGKSTLASQLHLKGYQLFSDDKCVLNWYEEEEVFKAAPSLKIIRLWADALDNLKSQEFLTSKIPVGNKENKFQFNLDGNQTGQIALPVRCINVIKNVKLDGKLWMEPADGILKMHILRAQTHRIANLKGIGKLKNHWKYLDKLSKNIQVNIIYRPLDTPIHDFVKFIEDALILKSVQK